MVSTTSGALSWSASTVALAPRLPTAVSGTRTGHERSGRTDRSSACGDDVPGEVAEPGDCPAFGRWWLWALSLGALDSPAGPGVGLCLL